MALLMAATAQPVRQPVDTIGFATRHWQMDSLMQRFGAGHPNGSSPAFKALVCPHDDYAYAGHLYTDGLKSLKAKTVILFGVAHKARLLGLKDQLIFDSFKAWKAPYGDITISHFREKLMAMLPADCYTVNDSMHQLEHSLEAIVPFIQYYSPQSEILPILVPYMDFATMDSLSTLVAGALHIMFEALQDAFGNEVAIIISNDAVHYGDEGWGGKNYATYGTDSNGYKAALRHEHEIIDSCLTGRLSEERLQRFCSYTVQESNYMEYKWTWCGRYSVPMGLLTANKLNILLESRPLQGKLLNYSTSIAQAPLKVSDLGMGVTAPAQLRHWVGYASIVFR